MNLRKIIRRIIGRTPLTTELMEVRNLLNEIPYINAGGCGISALAMYMYSKKNFNKIPKIIFTYREIYHLNINDKFLSSDSNSTIPPSHALLKYEDKYFDSNKIINKPTRSFEHEVTIDLLIESLKYRDRWNNMFDWKHLKAIEKKLNIKFPAEIIQINI